MLGGGAGEKVPAGVWDNGENWRHGCVAMTAVTAITELLRMCERNKGQQVVEV